MDALEQLRDLHVPDPVSFWPPAIGWWIVALLVLALGLLSIWALQHRRKMAPRRLALAELSALKTKFENTQNVSELMAGLSTLLRRYALFCFGRQKVAGLTGVAWLEFLDEHGNTQQFSSDIGRRAFTAVAYGAQKSVDAENMITLAERWIKHTPLPSRKKAA